jgi:hypothetical protein
MKEDRKWTNERRQKMQKEKWTYEDAAPKEKWTYEGISEKRPTSKKNCWRML